MTATDPAMSEVRIAAGFTTLRATGSILSTNGFAPNGTDRQVSTADRPRADSADARVAGAHRVATVGASLAVDLEEPLTADRAGLGVIRATGPPAVCTCFLVLVTANEAARRTRSRVGWANEQRMAVDRTC
jgi:hypothetical protein